MSKPRVLVLRSPGANCDQETAFAFEQAGAQAERLHVNRVLEEPRLLDEFQILCVPGGFSYGDDLGAGTILASVLRHQLGEALARFRDRDRLVLGICNGFQVLLKTGLLIERDEADGLPQATLADNTQGKYEDRWVHLQLTPGRCAFVREEARVELPVAHGEGKFTVRRSEVLEKLVAAGRVVARYVDAAGKPGPFPINPNGSMGDVAGVCDETGRVFALMPHPERHIFPYQHPRWTRRAEQPAVGAGLTLFRDVVAYFG